MTAEKARQIVLAARPQGKPQLTDFRLEETAIPTPGAGQVLLRVQYLSLDPYMRARMDDGPSYAKPTGIGDVMEGGTVATVLASQHAGFQPGETVLSYSGWQTHAVEKTEGLRKLDPAAAPVSTALGVLGMPGFTAYAGLLTIGQPKPGETVVVAAASGAVGSAGVAVRGEIGQELPLPRHFEKAASTVSRDDIAEVIVCGPDPDRHREGIQKFVDAGFDHVYIHQVGPDQTGFLRFFERELLAGRLDTSLTSAVKEAAGRR